MVKYFHYLRLNAHVLVAIVCLFACMQNNSVCVMDRFKKIRLPEISKLGNEKKIPSLWCSRSPSGSRKYPIGSQSALVLYYVLLNVSQKLPE